MSRVEISPERAKQLIDESDYALLVVANLEEKAVLGHVEPGNEEYECHMSTYEVGDREAIDDALLD